jgi:hypothetical protein
VPIAPTEAGGHDLRQRGNWQALFVADKKREKINAALVWPPIWHKLGPPILNTCRRSGRHPYAADGSEV